MPFTVEYHITLQLALSLLENVERSDDDLNKNIGIGPVHNFEEVLSALKFVIGENLKGKNIFMKIWAVEGKCGSGLDRFHLISPSDVKLLNK